MDGWSDGEVAELGERLIDLIALFMVQDGQAQASASDSSVTLAHRQRALAYMRQHLADPDLSPQRVADGCGLSVAYLHRILRAGGTSAEAHLRGAERCRELLLNPLHRHRSIAELAYQAGFSHPSHFSRLFKRRFGMTPRDWRARSDGPALARTFNSLIDRVSGRWYVGRMSTSATSSSSSAQRFEALAEIAKTLGHAHRLVLLEHVAQGERAVERLSELSD